MGASDRCPAKIRLYTTLQWFFKFIEFRPGQLEATLAVMHHKDVFVRMSTGSGKSVYVFVFISYQRRFNGADY